jgi:hypothetical protein
MKCSPTWVLTLIALVATSAVVPFDKPWPYLLSTQIVTSFQQDSSRSNADEVAFAFSCIGDYEQSLHFNDKNNIPQWTQKGFIKSTDTSFIQHSRPIPAKDYIIQRAINEQIIIINEAHYNPLHRVFTASLLKELYQAGFRWLAAETLNSRDSTLNQRHYPLISSGYYTREPQYGKLIRDALQLGYQVVAYEARTKDEFASGKSREIAQARHIQAILEKDPKAKILVHCGYDHVVEVPMSNSWQKAMAGRLKEFTDIDPLTIDQQQWTEQSQVAKEHPLYRSMKLSQASVFVDASGQVYPGLSVGRTDIQVAHPRTQYRYGRPNWLLQGGRCKPYFLKPAQCRLQLPCLVQAYVRDELAAQREPAQQAVPLDVMEVRDWGDKKALILPPGAYRLVLRNEEGQQQELLIRPK